MAKLDVSRLRMFYISAPYSTNKFVADMDDMLKIIGNSKNFNYLPEVKEISWHNGKFTRVKKSDIVAMATRNKSDLSKAAYDYIMKMWK
jgi:hypothetical protein